MSNVDIRQTLDPLLRQLEAEKSIDVAEKIISELVDLLGIRVSDRFLLNVPRIDAELSRFMLAPGFGRQAAAYDIPNDHPELMDLKLFWVKKTTKTNLSWLIGITPNYEDSEANDYKNISIDFIFPESADRLIILISDKFKIRSLELKDHVTHTQFEIFSNWKNIRIQDHKDIQEAKRHVHSKLWESFNFEPVNRAFYLELVESFSLLVHHLEKSFGRKPAVMFTTRLIGRLLFLWFLKKKNYINKGSGYFDINGSSDQTEYYKLKLEVLFFEVLNKEIVNRANGDNLTPYLNGGLFDPSETDFYKNEALTIPRGYFSNLYEALNKYNFTVDESSPEFQHVAIDPEMLGRIFESLLAEQIDEATGGNKKKVTGAFYTPREIVSYMCEESLIEFLKNKIPFSSDRDFRIEELIRLPETIFRDQDQNKRRDWKPYADSIINVLSGSNKNDPLTVLDPAVGSGAFPMGMLHLLVKIYGRLDTKYEKNISQLKRDILSKSLYGVDIEQTAIEICRLRAWLSIIVDAKEDEEIEPLPNLDFKFICANSLITLDGSDQTQLFSDEDLEVKLGVIRQDYFKTNNKQKKKNLQNQYIALTKNPDIFDNEKIKKLKNYNPFDVNSSSDFFDSKIMLGIDKFDIVIGNPPYVGESGNKEIFRRVVSSSNLSKYYIGKMDYFYFFFHLALNRVKRSGIISFITTNYFITAAGAIKLRADIRDRSKIIKLFNFNELKIFKSAKGQHNLITILSANQSLTPEVFTSLAITSHKGDAHPGELDDILHGRDNQTFYTSIASEKVFDGDKNYIRFFDQGDDNSVNSLLEKIKLNAKPLAYYCDVSQGVVSGCDYVSNRNISKLKNSDHVRNKDGIFVLDLANPRDVEVINTFTKEERTLLRPFYKNSDIYHYSCSNKPTKYLIYISSKEHKLECYPNIKRHLSKFRDILDDRREVANGRIEWFDLQWARNEQLFLGEKILVPYRASENFFGYTDAEWFCRSDVYLIKPRSKSFKKILAITGILNSSLVLFWLKHKGKKKGEVLELFPDFLNEIPISLDDEIAIKEIEDIISATFEDKSASRGSAAQSIIRDKVDHFVYRLYKLSQDDMNLIRGVIK